MGGRPIVGSVRNRADFEALRSSPTKATHGAVVVRRASRADASGESSVHQNGEIMVCVAYGVGTHVGNAVTRNRIRRRLRALVAEFVCNSELQSGNYLITARTSSAATSFDALRNDLRAAFRSVGAPRTGKHLVQ